MTKVIETLRLILRTWKDSDVDAYYQINQDPKVTEFFLGSLTMEQVKDFITAKSKQFDEKGYTLWAVEEKSRGLFIGFIGLDYISWKSDFTPAVEVGWRLGSQFWGKGYATEGAKAAIEYGFHHCGLKEIVSLTVPENMRSIRVMERLGMVRDTKADFAHPKLPLDHRLSHHILYRIKPLAIDES